MSDAPVGLRADGDVAILTIDHPPLNLFDRELVATLGAALGRAAADRPRALLITAAGEVFTGGADVNGFAGLSEADAQAFASELLAITHAVENMPFPTLAAVGGLCLTAGFELALACDLIVAARGARFGLVERVVGVTPFMGGTQRVAERAGPARARELVLTGDLYDAQTLERWNVVNRVVAEDELAEASLELARSLAEGPPLAHAVTKRIVRAQCDGGTRAADAVTPELVAPLFESSDLRAAVASFLEQGPGRAVFEGR